VGTLPIVPNLRDAPRRDYEHEVGTSSAPGGVTGLRMTIRLLARNPVGTLQRVSRMRASATRRFNIALRSIPPLRVLLLSCVACVATPLSRATDWPQFLGPNRNGSTTETNLASAWPKEGPPTLWQRKVGEGFSGPVVGGGKLILFHRLGDKEIVECLDAKSGRELWKGDAPTGYRDDFGFDEGPRATPAIADGHVVTFGAEGMLTCWNLATGAKVWSIETKSRFNAGKGFFGMACSPLVEGSAVIVNLGGRDGAGIVAFDRTTGKERWRATSDEASYSSPVAASLGGQRRGVVITREALVALNLNDGRILFRQGWRPPMHASVSAATPLVIDDLIFLSASYGTGATLFRFKEGAPETIWSSDEALSNHYSTSVHRDGFLYGFHGRADPGMQGDSALRCVELKTGKVRWSEANLKSGIVTRVNDQLLVLTEKGELLRAPATPEGFKAGDRAQILPLLARAHPALSDGLFYARSKDKLVCVDLRRKP
jgi:outer membrane protein assembly factor BamB